MRRPLNVDKRTVEGFGDEWSRFDQSQIPEQELAKMFASYFSIFPWDTLPQHAVGFDLGCGSGRWAKLVAPRVGKLHCIDPSSALDVARRNLAAFPNCEFHSATVGAIPLKDASMDFGYSLGVLHHVPDPEAGLRSCVAKLKPAAPFLVYLYYAFDNRPSWFRTVWRVSDILRRAVSRLPHRPRFAVSQLFAVCVYFPLARAALVAERLGVDVRNFPLSAYRSLSFYTMRTDALDRFGTRLEHRFSRGRIKGMMEGAGLERIRFSEAEPFWCAIGYRQTSTSERQG
jgi:SAM-dependent methyltransferase